MSEIKNKRIWLTGASSGIGEALAFALNKAGAYLVISSRRQSELQRVQGECANPSRVKILTLDLSQPSSLENKAMEAMALWEGGIDILINNGGISQRSRIIQTDHSVDRKLMEVNYFGNIALSKAVLPSMVRKQAGHHVVITSAVGIISTPLRSSYAASKHALHGFYDALRTEHYQDNIKVTLVCPGFIHTKISINALTKDGSAQNTMDTAQENGMTAEKCAQLIINAIKKNKEEVYIGGFKEKLGIYVKRYWPSLFSKMVRKMAVT